MRSLIPPGMRIPQPSDYIAFDAAFPPDFIANLIRSYPVFEGHRETLQDGLRFAHSVYVTHQMERDSYTGVANDKATKRLHDALDTAVKELGAPEMWVRLRAANAVAFPSADGVGFDADKHFTPMLPVVADLLTIVKAARKVDGRAIHQHRNGRWDLKGAASALYYYWELCSRDTTMWSGFGRESKSHAFIMDCLFRLDETAKESSIRDFLVAAP